MNDTKKGLLTVTKAAAFLQVSPSTIRNWADQGVLPHILTPGGHRRFFQNDLLFLTTVTPPPSPSNTSLKWMRLITEILLSFAVHSKQKLEWENQANAIFDEIEANAK